jgi:hypothetical protein
MAGGIDWFRWHHGTVTDPKFGVIAKKSGSRVSDVIAVWAFVLESASAEADRGQVGNIDHEALDFLLGLEDGQSSRIVEEMHARGLISTTDGRVCSWDKRQPKRERDTDNSAERVRAHRQRQKEQSEANDNQVTPCNATQRQSNARGEERREELKQAPTVHVETAVSPDAAPVEFDSQVIPIKDPVPYEKILSLYHELLPELATVAKLTTARKAHIRSRWKNDITSLESWRKYFQIVRESSFLMGRAPPGQNRTKPFQADFDFLINETNAIKVCEGKYHG